MTSNKTRARFFCSARDALALLAFENVQRQALADAVDRAIRIRAHARQVGMRIEREQEHLRFVDTLFAFVGPCAANRRAAGRKPECLRRDFGAGERLQSRLRLEAAFDAGRQILIEVVQPVARVGPSSTALAGALDVKRRFAARIAEAHHWLREARDDLPHVLDLPLRTERLDFRCVLRGHGRNQRQHYAKGQRTNSHRQVSEVTPLCRVE